MVISMLLVCLDGEDLKLVSIHINDEPWTAWKKEEGALIGINNLPERFTLKIVNEISRGSPTPPRAYQTRPMVLDLQPVRLKRFRHLRNDRSPGRAGAFYHQNCCR